MIVPCVCIATAARKERVDACLSGRSRSEQKRADTWNCPWTGSIGGREISSGCEPAGKGALEGATSLKPSGARRIGCACSPSPSCSAKRTRTHGCPCPPPPPAPLLPAGARHALHPLPAPECGEADDGVLQP